MRYGMDRPDPLPSPVAGVAAAPGAPVIRIALLCGSNRRGSANRRLLAEVACYIPPAIGVDALTPGELDLPLFDSDLLASDCAAPGVRARATALHRRLGLADALIVATPDCNGLPTPLLTSAIAWIALLPHLSAEFANAFAERPVLLCGAGGGWEGAAPAIASLRVLLGGLGALPFGDCLNLPLAHSAWDGTGALHDVMFEHQIARLVARFCALVERLAAPAAYRGIAG